MSAEATRRLRAWTAAHEPELVEWLGRVVDMGCSEQALS